MKKFCRGCLEEKPFECFSKTSNPAKGDRFGLRSKCKECRSKENLEWHRKNAIKSQENHKNWLDKNRDRSNAKAREWIKNNKEKHAANNSKWKKENPSRNAANTNRYRSAKIAGTPPWLSAIQQAQIQEFYEIAAAKTVQTGTKYHVDHIHPLKGQFFSGLNVPWNLRVITAYDNISKKNRVPDEDAGLFWSE